MYIYISYIVHYMSVSYHVYHIYIAYSVYIICIYIYNNNNNSNNNNSNNNNIHTLYHKCRMECRAIKDSQSAKAKRFPSVGIRSYGCRPIQFGPDAHSSSRVMNLPCQLQCLTWSPFSFWYGMVQDPCGKG